MGVLLPMRLLSYITFCAILLHNFSSGFIILNYYAHLSYIATHLCVNKDKPELHCNGKCFLKKQLEKDQQRNSTTTNSEKGFSDIVYFNYFTPLTALFFPETKMHFTSYLFRFIQQPSRPIFHPPAI